MNLRILVYSNPLVVDKISKKFQFWKDSGFIYTKQLISQLPKGWRFYWCIPDKITTPEDKNWFLESNENIELIPYPYSTSIHQNRYNFSVNTLSKYFNYGYDIDAVLNNQPEVTANLRVWFTNQRREHPLIFSFYHWIDCEESSKFGKDLSGYITRQVDGAKFSDYILFHNSYAYKLFSDEVSKFIISTYSENFEDKLRFFHPKPTIFEPVEFNTGVQEDKKIILFNHRLNNTTCWQEVISTLDKIYDCRKDFVLWITDDSKLKEYSNLETKEYIKVQSLKPSEYGYILKKAHFSICNHRGYSTWNMAVIDSIANGCLALIPNREVYQSMFINSLKKFGDLFSHTDNLEEQIIKLLDNTKEDNDALAYRICEEDYTSFVYIGEAGEYKNLIENSIIGASKTNPKKYSDVLDFIRKEESCYKKIWVNNFWSFHVNTNFQVIRKKLLLDSEIVDDTSYSETKYLYTGEK